MKKELQMILLFSVIACLFTMLQLAKEPAVSVNRHLFSGIATWQPPAIHKRQIKDDLVTAINPFSERFFETAALKGFIRNSNNEWCAIFDTAKGDARILEPGITKGGLTLVSSNGRYCRVKFGSVIREFKL